MRIFYASASSPNPNVASNLWRNNLYQTLVEMGHEVIEFDYDLQGAFQRFFAPIEPETEESLARLRTELSTALVEQINFHHQRKSIDLFFSYFYDCCVYPAAIDAINALGVPTANWYCNGSYQLDLVREISPHYSWCLVPEKFRIKDYQAMGAHPIYMQEAANPNIYKPYDLAKEVDVSFVGQAYGERPEFIHFLRGQGIDVRVWGPGWEYLVDYPSRNPLRRLWKSFQKPDGRIRFPQAIVGGRLSDLDLVKTYSRSKVNLGFSSCGETHTQGERILQIRLRDFEVPMSGGFYLVEYMEELEEFFETGKEIVCYRGREECAEKAKYYLAHESERERIRQAGHQRCLRDHTWQRRFENAFKAMGFR